MTTATDQLGGGAAPIMPSQTQVLADMGAPVPEGYKIPDAYLVDRNGIIRVTVVERKGGDAEEKVEHIASAPCFPVAILRDDQGEELVELAWLHYGKWRRRAVPRAVTRSGRKLVSALGDAGFPIMDSTARKMEGWLDLVESLNRERLPVTTIARVLGWQPDGTFVTGPGAPYPVEPPANLDHVANAHKPAGELADWQAVAELAAGQPLALMPIYAALAAPLLDVLRVPSFTVDLCGETSSGKSTAAELGMSVWADPHEAVATWNGTRVALEHRLSLVKGLPVVIDETSTNRNPEDVRDMLYVIHQGRQKARGAVDGVRQQLTWHTVAITTGERPIVTFATDGGTSARVLTLEGSPFGEGGGDAAIAVRDGCHRSYGTAGPAFVARLVEAIHDGRRDDLRAKWEQLIASFQTGGRINQRRASYVAAIYLAAGLAHGWGILTFEAPDLDTWRELFSREDARDDRPAMALAVVRDWVAGNPHRLYGYTKTVGAGNYEHEDDSPPPQGWAGKEQLEAEFALFPEHVRRILKDAGYELDAVKGGWAKAGALKTRRGQDNNLTYPVRMGDGKQHGMYWFLAPEPEPEPTSLDLAG